MIAALLEIVGFVLCIWLILFALGNAPRRTQMIREVRAQVTAIQKAWNDTTPAWSDTTHKPKPQPAKGAAAR